MNKWQIICPLVAMTLFFGVLGYGKVRQDRFYVQEAIKRDLKNYVSMLFQEERFPSVESAESILDEAVRRRKVRCTSLSLGHELFYNPHQPKDGNREVVLCREIDGIIFAIQADGRTREIGAKEMADLKLIPLKRVVNAERAVRNGEVAPVTGK